MSLQQSNARVIGIDYGTKRIGIAKSDPLMLFSIPVGTYTPNESLHVVRKIKAQEGIREIVIGWPLTLNGEEGKTAGLVQEYINRLAKVAPTVPVHKIDERYSSKRAVQALVSAKVKKKDRREKGRIDSAAAAIILQDYLDELSEG